MKKHGNDVFVGPHPDGGWQVKKAGATKAYRRTTNQKEAIAIGRAMAKREGSELVIQKATGQIQKKDSHGHDDRRRRG